MTLLFPSTAQWFYPLLIMPILFGTGIIKGENYELQLIQNKALRSVYKVRLEKNPKFTTDQLHEKSRCQKLCDRRDLHLVILCTYTVPKMIQ